MVRVKLAKPTQVGGRIREAGDVVDVADSRVAHFDANGYVAEYMDDVDLLSGDGTVYVRHEDPDPNGPMEAHFETQAEAIAYAKQVLSEADIPFGDDVPTEDDPNTYTISVPVWMSEELLQTFIAASKPEGDDPNMANGGTGESPDSPPVLSDLDKLGLDAETVEALREGGYNSIDALVDVNARDLQALENIGKARSQQILDALKAHGS